MCLEGILYPWEVVREGKEILQMDKYRHKTLCRAQVTEDGIERWPKLSSELRIPRRVWPRHPTAPASAPSKPGRI